MAQVVFISLEDWDDIWRRNQFICAELANRGHQILFVQPPRDLSSGIRRRDWSQFVSEGLWSPRDYPNILVMRPVKLAPKSWSLGRVANAQLLENALRKQLKKLHWQRPLLWINDHNAWHLMGKIGEGATVYDITDDWIAFETNPLYRTVVEQQDRDLCRQADAVIVCSRTLFDLKSRLVSSDRLHLIPNGVHVDHYRSIGTKGSSQAQHPWQRPVLGYTGTIHPDRLDVELVRAVAQAPGIGSIVLAGPNLLLPKDLDRLRLPNIHLTGPIPYRDIPAMMDNFDVCIVPHLITPFTESLNPIKLWEYLAAGKPVVATNVAGFRDYPNLLSIAHNYQEFVAAALKSSMEEPSKKALRRAEAEKNAWSERVDRVQELLLRLCSNDLEASCVV